MGILDKPSHQRLTTVAYLCKPNEPEKQVGNTLPGNGWRRHHGNRVGGVVVLPVQFRVQPLLHHLCRGSQGNQSAKRHIQPKRQNPASLKRQNPFFFQPLHYHLHIIHYYTFSGKRPRLCRPVQVVLTWPRLTYSLRSHQDSFIRRYSSTELKTSSESATTKTTIPQQQTYIWYIYYSLLLQ